MNIKKTSYCEIFFRNLYALTIIQLIFYVESYNVITKKILTKSETFVI